MSRPISQPKSRRSRIYILPTRFGLVFVTGAMIMILIGATYQNNLVNLLAFFMLSLIFISMVQTHNNLRDVDVQNLEIENGFANRDQLVTAVLRNSSQTSRFNLEYNLRKRPALSLYENVHPLLSQSTLKLRASYLCGKRGQHTIKEIRISTVFPLGLFRAWRWLDTDSHYLVYPEPKGARLFPTGGIGDSSALATTAKGGDDFYGHRKFQIGDPPGHVDWKALARGRPLMVKEFKEGALQSVLLDWYALEGIETEERLSQLSQWVDEASRRNLSFALRLPGTNIVAGVGHTHAARCFEALAVFEGVIDAAS